MIERVRLNKNGGGGQYFAAPNTSVKFVSSGCKVFDLALGGGWAEGRIANIVGDTSTGKTLLCIEAAANYARKHKRGRILYREAEAAFDEPYAEALGMPIKRVEFVEEPMESVEDFYEDLKKVVEDAVRTGDPALYMLDSLDALSDRAEMERDMDKGSYGADKAKKMGQLFRRLVRSMEAADVTLIIVSQIRDKIGITFGRKYSRTGGRALDFYASQVAYLAHVETLHQTLHKIKRATGISVKAKVTKNKVGLPFREAEFNIGFGYGIEDGQACEDWLSKVGLPKGEKGQISSIPTDRLYQLVERRWWEIEKSFLPTRKKYVYD